MMYVSGHVRDGWPAMLTPRMGQLPPAGQPWAADTGCYARPQDHDDDAYLAWLASLPAERCLFATAPDRFGDGMATLELAEPMLPRIRALGLPAALVAQPGMTQVPWDALDVLFIGGPNAWQHSDACAELAREAVRRGKRVHVGRVNTLRRLRFAQSIGATSVDGTCLAYGPDRNAAIIMGWLQRLHRQPMIWEG
jgi:hypothetical protein